MPAASTAGAQQRDGAGEPEAESGDGRLMGPSPVSHRVRWGPVPLRPTRGLPGQRVEDRRLHVSRSSRTAATSAVATKAPSSLSVSRMATGRPPTSAT